MVALSESSHGLQGRLGRDIFASAEHDKKRKSIPFDLAFETLRKAAAQAYCQTDWVAVRATCSLTLSSQWLGGMGHSLDEIRLRSEPRGGMAHDSLYKEAIRAKYCCQSDTPDRSCLRLRHHWYHLVSLVV